MKIIKILIVTFLWMAGLYILCAFTSDGETWKVWFSVCAVIGWSVASMSILTIWYNIKGW